MTEMKQSKAEMIQAILAECDQRGLVLGTQKAYVLATAEWETNGTFQPVIESYWVKNPDAYNKAHHPDYYPYYGRGLAQLTWERNYLKYGKLLNLDLVGQPDLALRPDVAVFVLVHGLKTGGFTGKKLEEYVNASKTQFLNARRCVNGTDKAAKIATLANAWVGRLRENGA